MPFDYIVMGLKHYSNQKANIFKLPKFQTVTLKQI